MAGLGLDKPCYSLAEFQKCIIAHIIKWRVLLKRRKSMLYDKLIRTLECLIDSQDNLLLTYRFILKVSRSIDVILLGSPKKYKVSLA